MYFKIRLDTLNLSTKNYL